jgi:ubiquinone biosynthesis protein
MLGIFVEGGAQFLGLSVFGLIGFVIAAILGLLLLFAIIRSGRL